MKDIVETMVEDGLLDEAAVARVRRMQAEGVPVDQALTDAGPPPDTLLPYLAEVFSVPYVELESAPIDGKLLREFPARLLLKHSLLPLREVKGAVLVATSRLFDTSGMDELRLATGRELLPALAPPSEIARCVKQHLGVGADTVQSLVSDAVEAGIQLVSYTDEAVDLAGGGGRLHNPSRQPSAD